MARYAGSFVGRARELDALTNVGFWVTRRRRPAAAFVVGDPGSGKSRLLAEASKRIASGH